MNAEIEARQHLVRMGKGMAHNVRVLGRETPWRGATSVSSQPFDREQVEINKKLYPHLFRGDR